MYPHRICAGTGLGRRRSVAARTAAQEFFVASDAAAFISHTRQARGGLTRRAHAVRAVARVSPWAN
jgi:hypothetical protein